MTNQEAIERLRGILTEAIEFENSVCYVTEEDREPLEMAIKALENQKTGHWIDYGARYDVRCSICNTQCPLKPISSSRLMVCKSDYCPSCGAKMEGE